MIYGFMQGINNVYNNVLESGILGNGNIPIYYIIITIASVLIPITSMFIMMKREFSRISVLLMVANILCLVCNMVGAISMNPVITRSELYMELRIEFLLEILFYSFYLAFVYRYLEIKKVWTLRLFIAFVAFTVWCVLNRQFSSLLYDDFEVKSAIYNSYEYRYIQYNYGVVFYLDYALLTLLLVILLIVIIRKIKKSYIKIEKNKFIVLLVGHCMMIFSTLAWAFAFLSRSYDFLPLMLAVTMRVIVIGTISGNFLGMVETSRKLAFEELDDAFIIANERLEYIESNKYAKKLFPKLDEIKPGSMMPQEIITYFTQCSITGMDEVALELDSEYVKGQLADLYTIEDRYYRPIVTELTEKANLFIRIFFPKKGKAKTTGYSLLLIDTTRQVELLKQVNEERQKALDAAQSKADFLSNMSHEIRTPMNAIVGMTEIMMREKLPDQIKGYLANIKNSGDALLSIINDILDFSKIESGKLEIIDEEYEPMSMLLDLSMIFLNRIGERQVELVYDIDTKLPHMLLGDSVRIRQVITNIVNNAIKFTDDGYVKLTIRLEDTKEENIRLNFEVRDSGQGIKQEDIGKLFGSFSQVDTKRNRKKEGTGLGLAISKNLVEAMGGSISVSSEYGKGSTFSFDILQKVVDSTPAAYIKDENKDQIVSGLFFSDEVRNTFRHMCDEFGIKCVEYSDVTSGREQAEIIFVGITMYELYKEELDELKNKGIKHLVVQNPMVDRSDGCTFVINKPIFSLNFAQVLNHEKVVGYETHAETIDFVAPDARILIVDDNEMNLKVACGLLAPIQLQIDTSIGARDALEMLEDDKYDIIFMDHMMPEMDGVEATQLIRSYDSEYMKKVPIIALTANALAGAKEEFIAAGMDDFVPKPIEMNVICNKIKKYLKPELIKRQKVDINQDFMKDQADQIGELSGIDIKKGLTNSGSASLFKGFLSDYRKLIDLKTRQIRQCLEDNDIRNFTIEVHALKSTSYTIGAMHMGDRFYELEMLGNDDNKQAILDKIDDVLSEFEDFKEILIDYAPKDAPKTEESKETILEILNAIAHSADVFDVDTVDAKLEELKSIKLPESVADKMDALDALVADLDADGIIEQVKEIEKLL